MTTQLPRSEGHPPATLGRDDGVVVPDRDLAEARASVEAPPATRPGPAGTTDYRLRGLDLDAHAFAEVPSRTMRNRHPSRRRRRRRHVIQFVVVLAVIALVAVMLRAWAVEPFSVSSSSMEPTLRAGTDVLVMKSPLVGSFGTGDIVVVEKPAGVTCNAGGDRSSQLVERVIALPGQTIRSIRGRIFIDGRRFHEAGWYDTEFGETGPVDIAATTVPPKSYFVMGDNRHEGCDSRAFGAVPESSVVGEVVATVTRDGHAYLHLM